MPPPTTVLASTPTSAVCVVVASIPAGDCDCNNQLDALGVCSGDCAADADADGICDDVDDCVERARRVRNLQQPGAIYECRCATSHKATATATATTRRLGRVWCDCAADADADGICDNVDDCVGALDECGISTAQAPSTSWCSDIPAGDSTVTATS